MARKQQPNNFTQGFGDAFKSASQEAMMMTLRDLLNKPEKEQMAAAREQSLERGRYEASRRPFDEEKDKASIESIRALTREREGKTAARTALEGHSKDPLFEQANDNYQSMIRTLNSSPLGQLEIAKRDMLDPVTREEFIRNEIISLRRAKSGKQNPAAAAQKKVLSGEEKLAEKWKF